MLKSKRGSLADHVNGVMRFATRRARSKAFQILDRLSPLVLPVCITTFFLRRHFINKKKALATKKVERGTPATWPPQAAKPRRDFKIKREARTEAANEEAQIRHQKLLEQLANASNQGAVATTTADSEDTAETSKGGEGDQQSFFKMLQSMGFKVMPGKDGQVFLVPPGQEGGEDGQEVDEMIGEEEGEGYDEDDDGGEEDEVVEEQ
ncbi:hypothetical protein CEUSTIGMA_g6233.t1 [Chlamydomonas eustigma]|uniref:Uncharacterized protein n=1 Tax=Chlamydomonas eustigma TaxID=1157962 RepID=A0A250X6X3_9CHLO|nr:hypothetical protein CEUSTIGMA_g6233.t1 [Chlamydomonas eustigma]|eukprot:GAX78796.1 hypothetical protein CEUSTIGMA_g6233.t1 [Chlamydomonas eustigma]